MLLFLAQSDTLKSAQVVLSLAVAFSVLAIVLELVRRQKLREEYAILWIATSGVLILLALYKRSLQWLANVLEADSLVSVLYFGALVFLLLVALQFSVRLTKLTFRTKTANQRIALLEAEINELRQLLADHVEETSEGFASDRRGLSKELPGETSPARPQTLSAPPREDGSEAPATPTAATPTEALRPKTRRDPVS